MWKHTQDLIFSLFSLSLSSHCVNGTVSLYSWQIFRFISFHFISTVFHMLDEERERVRLRPRWCRSISGWWSLTCCGLFFHSTEMGAWKIPRMQLYYLRLMSASLQIKYKQMQMHIQYKQPHTHKLTPTDNSNWLQAVHNEMLFRPIPFINRILLAILKSTFVPNFPVKTQKLSKSISNQDQKMFKMFICFGVNIDVFLHFP